MDTIKFRAAWRFYGEEEGHRGVFDLPAHVANARHSVRLAHIRREVAERENVTTERVIMLGCRRADA